MATKRIEYDNPLFRTYSDESGNSEQERKKGRPRKDGIIRNESGGNSSQEGLTEEYTRFSVICKVNNVKDLKDYAFTKRLTIREATDEIIESFFERYKSDPKNEKLLDHTRKGRSK